MKIALLSASLIAASLAFGNGAQAANNKIFSLVVSSATCAPGARGRVTVAPAAGADHMHVEVSGLPANTDFAFFLIQVPKAPFGMSWYQGDIVTDANGLGVGDFAGIFSVETFTVAPGVAPAPKTFPTSATTNPATPPVQMYHVGLWFDSPADAVAAGCAGAVTPFNGRHNAGVQVLNSGNFPDLRGPLRSIQ